MSPLAHLIAEIVCGAIGVWLLWQFVTRKPTSSRLERPSATVPDAFLFFSNPEEVIKAIERGQIQRVEIVTTDEGPFRPDVFWVLTGKQTEYVIPQGATGESKLLQHLQSLPNFDNDAVISAMVSTSKTRFLCWQREESSRETTVDG